uniref:Palmitoyl-protein thioesterase 1 n=1 Tax=Caenorhabditis japonica TaxID=281687 RepID=A0A8R1HMJ7_CAEJA
MNPPRIILLSLLLVAAVQGSPPRNGTKQVPVVIWHGMGDCCCNPISMGSVKKLIEDTNPGTYVHSLKLGASITKDIEHGFFANVNELVYMACIKIKNDPELVNGYNAIGFSQGAQFLVVQAQYWHDPKNVQEYKERSIFLADINNENKNNPTYKRNLLQLKNLVLIKFNQDHMVVPKESSWFGFYKDGDIDTILAMNETDLYTQDRIGLRKLNESGRLHFLSVDGDHLQVSREFLVDKIIKKYFM